MEFTRSKKGDVYDIPSSSPDPPATSSPTPAPAPAPETSETPDHVQRAQMIAQQKEKEEYEARQLRKKLRLESGHYDTWIPKSTKGKGTRAMCLRSCILCEARNTTCAKSKLENLPCLNKLIFDKGGESVKAMTLNDYIPSKELRPCPDEIQGTLPPFAPAGTSSTKMIVIDDPESTAAAQALSRGALPELQRLTNAIQYFLRDFCVPSSIHNDSNGQQHHRGFIGGLENMFTVAKDNMFLGRICQAVTFLTYGQKLGMPEMIQEGEELYEEVLSAIRLVIARFAQFLDRPDWTYIVLIAGLYEMMMPTPVNEAGYFVHGRGLATINEFKPSLKALLENVQTGIRNKDDNFEMRVLFDVSRSKYRRFSKTLDEMVAHVFQLWHCLMDSKSQIDFAKARRHLLDLEMELKYWNVSMSDEQRPFFAVLQHADANGPIEVGRWPGPIESYPDMYLASIWNVYRMSRLLVTFMLYLLKSEYRTADSDREIYNYHTQAVVVHIMASIPYHIASDLRGFCNGKSLAESGHTSTVGGVLITHTLYVASQMPFLSDIARDYLKRCLWYIGTKMGVGHARVLAEATGLNIEPIKTGSHLLWQGYLC